MREAAHALHRLQHLGLSHEHARGAVDRLVVADGVGNALVRVEAVLVVAEGHVEHRVNLGDE